MGGINNYVINEDSIGEAISNLRSLKGSRNDDKIVQAVMHARSISAEIVSTFERELESTDSDSKDKDLVSILENIKRLNDYTSNETLEQKEEIIDEITNEITKQDIRDDYDLLVKAFVLSTMAVREADKVDKQKILATAELFDYLRAETDEQRIVRLTEQVNIEQKNINVAALRSIDLLLALKIVTKDTNVEKIVEHIMKLNLKSNLPEKNGTTQTEHILSFVAALPDNYIKEALNVVTKVLLQQNYNQRMNHVMKAAKKAAAFEKALEKQIEIQIDSAVDCMQRLQSMLVKKGDPSINEIQKNMIMQFGRSTNIALNTLLQTYRDHHTEFTIDVDFVKMILEIRNGLDGALDYAFNQWAAGQSVKSTDSDSSFENQYHLRKSPSICYDSDDSDASDSDSYVETPVPTTPKKSGRYSRRS